MTPHSRKQFALRIAFGQMRADEVERIQRLLQREQVFRTPAALPTRVGRLCGPLRNLAFNRTLLVARHSEFIVGSSLRRARQGAGQPHRQTAHDNPRNQPSHFYRARRRAHIEAASRGARCVGGL